MLKDGAKYSREEVNREFLVRKLVIWDFLVRKFNEKYIPKVVRGQLAIEFQGLKQGRCPLLSTTSNSRNYQDMLED